MQPDLSYPIALAIGGFAVYTDTRFGLIPNKVTFPAVGLGLALHLVTGGWDGLVFSTEGMALGLGLFLIPFLIGSMGAGDVKLLAALGAFVGPAQIFAVFLLCAMLGGVVGLVVLVRRFGWSFFSFTLLTDRAALVGPAWGGTRLTAFPFASAIFFGLFASLFVR